MLNLQEPQIKLRRGGGEEQGFLKITKLLTSEKELYSMRNVRNAKMIKCNDKQGWRIRNDLGEENQNLRIVLCLCPSGCMVGCDGCLFV